MSDTNSIRNAVVLSGGASQGAYHVGVLKALFNGESPATNYQPLRPDVFTGTSAGSINAAALLGEIEADNPDPIGYLEKLWLERIARTGTSCGSGVYRVRGNPARFADFGCLITNPLKPPLDILQDLNFLAQESVRRGRQFLTSTERLGQRILNQLNLSSFIAMDPFQAVLQNAIRFDLVHRSSRYIRIGAVRWDTGYLHYFNNADLTVDVGPKIIQAS
ncbi:MAG: patatin-like phospholipase family protein, partial [Pirellula sp.]